MMKSVFAALLVGACLGASMEDILSELSEREMDEDMTEDSHAGTVPFSVRYSNELVRAGVSEGEFLAAYRTYCTNLAETASDCSFDLSTLRLSGALSVLEQYDVENFPNLLGDLIKRCPSRILVDDMSYKYVKNLHFGLGPMQLYRSSEFRQLPRERKDAAFKGLFSAQVNQGCSESATNRVISLALDAACNHSTSWELSDSTVCRLWPAYATSSNRYIAAQLARQAVPPCASSNYLNRVIAELEALPSGTMQMLSTNHLGQAWEE